MNFKSACIFVDGENLRHSIIDLFESDFNPCDYLPKAAEWQAFFDALVSKAEAQLRLRTYWYVVEEIDFWPYGVQKLLNSNNFPVLETVLRKFKPNRITLDSISDPGLKQQRLVPMARAIIAREKAMKARFEGWQVFQNGIAHRFESIEFRRAGSIRYDLFTQKFGKEKGVDVKLATDVLKLKDIYEVGIIVSGDGDYVPAVQAVKDWGKHMVNVSFLKKSGGVLPGGARRLNQSTDRVIELEYDDVRTFMKIAPATSVPIQLPPPVVTS